MSNATDLSSILDTVYSWISSRNLVDDQKIYIEDPNVDRPLPPSISYRMLTLPSSTGSRDSSTYSEAKSLTVISGNRDLTISIKAYGENASQIISNLYNSFELESVQILFQAANMGVRVQNTPQDISQELETGIEERYNMDIIFGVSSIQEEDLGEIAVINIVDAKLKNEADEVVQTVNETITKP